MAEQNNSINKWRILRSNNVRFGGHCDRIIVLEYCHDSPTQYLLERTVEFKNSELDLAPQLNELYINGEPYKNLERVCSFKFEGNDAHIVVMVKVM